MRALSDTREGTEDGKAMGFFDEEAPGGRFGDGDGFLEMSSASAEKKFDDPGMASDGCVEEGSVFFCMDVSTCVEKHSNHGETSAGRSVAKGVIVICVDVCTRL